MPSPIEIFTANWIYILTVGDHDNVLLGVFANEKAARAFMRKHYKATNPAKTSVRYVINCTRETTHVNRPTGRFETWRGSEGKLKLLRKEEVQAQFVLFEPLEDYMGGDVYSPLTKKVNNALWSLGGRFTGGGTGFGSGVYDHSYEIPDTFEEDARNAFKGMKIKFKFQGYSNPWEY